MLFSHYNNLLTFPFVAEAVAAGELSLHGAWHDFGTGTLLAYNPDTDSFEKIPPEETPEQASPIIFL